MFCFFKCDAVGLNFTLTAQVLNKHFLEQRLGVNSLGLSIVLKLSISVLFLLFSIISIIPQTESESFMGKDSALYLLIDSDKETARTATLSLHILHNKLGKHG